MRILITTLILLSVLACPVAAATPTQLLRIDKAEETTSTRLSLDFSALPERVDVDGGRLNLIVDRWGLVQISDVRFSLAKGERDSLPTHLQGA